MLDQIICNLAHPTRLNADLLVRESSGMSDATSGWSYRMESGTIRQDAPKEWHDQDQYGFVKHALGTTIPLKSLRTLSETFETILKS